MAEVTRAGSRFVDTYIESPLRLQNDADGPRPKTGWGRSERDVKREKRTAGCSFRKKVNQCESRAFVAVTPCFGLIS